MKIINRILILATSIFIIGCSSVRVPTNVVKAKRVIENNTRQINAIAEFHNLKSPFIRLDTIIFNVPESRNTFFVPSSLSKNLGIALNDYLSFTDSSKISGVTEKIREVIKNTEVNHVYQDSLLKISVKGNADSLLIDYVIFERILEKPIETEVVSIETNVKWFEDRFLQAFLFFVLLFLIYLVIRREGGIKPPSLRLD